MSFNSFNNQVLIFNNKIKLNLVLVYIINTPMKHVYNLINIFIQKQI